MKYSAALKFLAILLCAAMLLATAACALGIFALNESGLYQKSWYNAYNDYRGQVLQQAAQSIAQRYAAQQGGLDKHMINSYYGDLWYLNSFRNGQMGYTLYDESGAEGETLQLANQSAGYETMEVRVSTFSYPKAVEIITPEAYNAAMGITQPAYDSVYHSIGGSTTVYDAVPEGGAVVHSITAGYGDSSEGVASPEGLGRILHTAEGYVAFHADMSGTLEVDPEKTLQSIRFENDELGLLYEITDPQGVGSLAMDENGLVTFHSDTVNPDYASVTEQTIPDAEEARSEEETRETTTDQPVPEESKPAVMARALIPSGNYLTYYDPSQGQERVLCYTMEQASDYRVVFCLTDRALWEDDTWRLLSWVDGFREYLIPVMAASALLFVLSAAYLCCAAGHSRKREEVYPGGLNRLGLDGYLILLCGTGVGAAFLLMEGVPYLMEGSLEVALFFGGAICYGACVLFVAFCFACAAQFKTPGGYWWRHSLCSWCYRLAVACLTWGIRGLKVLWKWFSAFCQWLARWVDESVFPWAKRSLGALRKILCAVAIVLWQWLRACLRLIKKGLSRLKKGFVRFVGMLPMTWQWLMAGFAIVIVLALTVNTRFGFWGICATIALVLYGAHAFGILLGGVKRMNKGDLDNKVEDKLLVGSFKDFAQELNGLANVAMVAAQKQLKSERMKTELITNVSHDIKTPLTSIINYVDLLEKPHTEQEQTAYLEVLSRQSQRLKKLVDDLMEMSKASTGNMAVDITTVDAVEAVNQALGEFADKLDKAQLIPVFRQPQEQVAMRADGRLVWRILSNLLGNAVKYALPGTRIYLDLNRVGDTVVLSMKNISREELNVSAEELLERFVRGDVSRNTEGSGLGLNIAKSLMELQKGSLNLLVDGDLFKVTLIFPAEG